MEASKGFTISAAASRKVLCVNPKVQALQAAWRINDQCLQMQSQSTSKKQVIAGMLCHYPAPSTCDFCATTFSNQAPSHGHAASTADLPDSIIDKPEHTKQCVLMHMRNVPNATIMNVCLFEFEEIQLSALSYTKRKICMEWDVINAGSRRTGKYLNMCIRFLG